MQSKNKTIVRLKDYRPADYKVTHMDLEFSLGADRTVVKSKMKVERSKETKAGTPLVFDGDELGLEKIAINGRNLDSCEYETTSEYLKLPAPPKARQFILETRVRLNPQANTRLMGLYLSNRKYCTQCEAEGFRRITWFPDRPDILATCTTRIEADRNEAPVLLGNGNPVDSGELPNNRHFLVWDDPHPKPSYLFALAAGDFGSIHEKFKTASGRQVKLAIHVEKGKEKQAHYAMKALIRSMKWDEEVFDCEYDLDVFNIVAISDFNMGAMENKGLNIFNDKYVLADATTATDTDFINIERIIAHEYFHNWTGNRVTCRNWFQLCLKEGLTVYRDQEFSSDMHSRSVKRIEDVRKLRINQFAEDAGSLAHPVRPETYSEINNFYTPTVYEKGAEIIRMLATILGEKPFKKAVGLYLHRYDGKAATIEDFLKCFGDVSKRNLDQFALWYSQAGTPLVTVTPNYDAGTHSLSLEIEQSLTPTPGQAKKKLMHIPLKVGLVGKDGHDIPVTGITGCEHDDDLIHITRRKHKIVFHGVKRRPVISLNRNFTAPINLKINQTGTQLAFLATHDSDLFNRWQAFQTYATKLLVKAARSFARGKVVRFEEKFLDTAFTLAINQQLPTAFRALSLSLPDEGELARAMGKQVNPDAIHTCRNLLMSAIGMRLMNGWHELWRETRVTEAYLPDTEQSGKRSLRNVILDMGVTANRKEAKEASMEQFLHASNMTDRFAAFSRIVLRHKSSKDAKIAIHGFYERFNNNPLVLNKWFSLQASTPGTGAASLVRKLMRHEKFTLNNPNRVYALLGSFAFNNPTGFNAMDGAGYQLIVNIVEKVDEINPHVAAHLLTAFRSIDDLESQRKKQAIKALEKLQKNMALSTNAQDILERSLNG